MSRADVVEALRDYLYYRECFGDDTLDAPDVVSAIDAADRLALAVCQVLDIKRYELM